jgi:hypothetical protein
MTILFYAILVFSVPSIHWHWGWFALSVLCSMLSDVKGARVVHKYKYTTDEDLDGEEVR